MVLIQEAEEVAEEMQVVLGRMAGEE